MIDFDAFTFQVRGTHLVPNDIHSEEKMQELKQGDLVNVKIHKPRSEGYHNHVFGLLSKIAKYEKENNRAFKDTEFLYDMLKRETKCFYFAFDPFSGREVLRTTSFSKKKADQVKFQQWWETQAIPLLVTYLGFDPYVLFNKGENYNARYFTK